MLVIAVQMTLESISVIIFWLFFIIYHRSESPQVKEYLISSITT